jgi:hypothetical protein
VARKLGRGLFQGKKVELASSERVDELRGIADEFMLEIFDFLPGDYLITDESTLFDFTEMGSGDTSPIWDLIAERYGIRRDDVSSERLIDIFAEIRARNNLQ